MECMAQTQEVRKKKRKTKSLKEMAGSQLAVIPSQRTQKLPATVAAVSAITERWEVQFSRLFGYPPFTSTCPDLVPLPPKVRNRRPLGNWISSSSPAMLQLARDHSNSDVILTVCFSGKIQEEHYVSKLHFVWPQVSCISGFPARGTRAVFISYRDSLGEIQKFALRFLSAQEAEKFMNALKDIFKEGGDIEPLNTDFGSEISSQSEFMSSNRPLNGTCKDLTTMTPVQADIPQMSPSLKNEAEQYSRTKEITPTRGHAYIPQMSPSFKNEADQYSHTQFTPIPGHAYIPQISPSLKNEAEQYSSIPKITPIPAQAYIPQMSPSLKNEAGQYSHTPGITPIHNFQSNFAALPPSFTSLLSNCHPVVEQAAAQSNVPLEADLKSQIARYMEDSSFQDMLIKVEKIMGEMGGGLML